MNKNGENKSLHRTPDPLRVEIHMATQPLTLKSTLAPGQGFCEL